MSESELERSRRINARFSFKIPLSKEKIEQLREYHGINDWLYETSVIDFVRAIEKEHGII